LDQQKYKNRFDFLSWISQHQLAAFSSLNNTSEAEDMVQHNTPSSLRWRIITSAATIQFRVLGALISKIGNVVLKQPTDGINDFQVSHGSG
jgi:hypothetical protein